MVRIATLAAERAQRGDAVVRELYELEALAGHDEPAADPDGVMQFEQFVSNQIDSPNAVPEASFLAFDGQRLVVMTGHAFQVLIEDDQLRASLSAIHSALTTDGRFVFETRNPLVRAWESWTHHHPHKPVLGSSSDQSKHVAVSGCRFAVPLPVQGGPGIEEQFGDWKRQPLTDTSPEIITTARRAAGEGVTKHEGKIR